MKQISQEEFEHYVGEMIIGTLSKAKVVKELETDGRTLNNKIQELAATNPDLYQRYIDKRPYKPRERKDIDAMQLAIEILKQDKTIEQIAKYYQTGRRTIQRRIEKLGASSNPLERQVYELCKEVARYNKARGSRMPEELQMRIQDVLDEIAISLEIPAGNRGQEINIEERRANLLELERRYNELCATMSKTEAANALGYTPNRIYKLLNELYRIQIETGIKKVDFRQGLKVDVAEPSVQQEESTTGEAEKERE